MQRSTHRSPRTSRGAGLLCLVLSVFLILFVLLPLKASAGVYSSVLRFRVVANSDSAEDQAVKFAVRDFVLENTEEGLSACRNREEATAYLLFAKEKIAQNVRAFLREQGVSYSAEVVLEDAYHPAKVYEDVTLPQGVYRSFRIELGQAAGENFFCVLFPPICQNTAKVPASEVLLRYGVPGESVKQAAGAPRRQTRFFLWDALRLLFAL